MREGITSNDVVVEDPFAPPRFGAATGIVTSCDRHPPLSPTTFAFLKLSPFGHSSAPSSSASSSSSGYPPPLNSSFDDRMRRPSVQVAQVVRAPTQDDINKMELDAEVVPRSELRLLVTDRAAEVRTERVK